MPSETISKEDFLERARMYLGDEIFEAQKDTVERCDCGNPWCTGWRIEPGAFGEPQEDQ